LKSVGSCPVGEGVGFVVGAEHKLAPQKIFSAYAPAWGKYNSRHHQLNLALTYEHYWQQRKLLQYKCKSDLYLQKIHR